MSMPYQQPVYLMLYATLDISLLTYKLKNMHPVGCQSLPQNTKIK